MNHVDRHNGIGLFDRPFRSGSIESERRAKVEQPRDRPMGRDASQSLLVLIRWLPRQPRKCGRKVHRMLARAAGDLQDGSCRRKHPSQYAQDWIPVAGHRR